MINNRKNKKLLLVLGALALSIIIGIFMMSTVLAKDDEAKNEITSITLNKKKTDISIEISLTKEFVRDNKSEKLYLFELFPYQSTSELSDITPVETFKTDDKITVKLPYYVDNTTNRLFSKFVVAQKVSDGSYKIITSAKYIENIEILAANSEPFPTGSSKKGLIIDSLLDAQLLGVQHTVVDVPINELMHGENSANAASIHHNGQTFYIDTVGMAKLEHTVKSYSDAGIAVYLNLILTAPDENTHEKLLNFYYSDLTYGAKYYAFNTRNEFAMKSLQAFLDYICYRFTTPEHTHGFVPAIILGFEVNSNRTGNNAGPQDISSYTYSYTTAFRMVYTALRSYYSEGRVYVSIGNNWTSDVNDLSLTPDAYLDYPAKDFLDIFRVAIKNSGDIPWGISINPNASSDDRSDYWNDTHATDSTDTEFITMKNIGVLTEYLNEDELLCDGKVRSVIVGEFGISGRPFDTASLNTQAAGYALAYYTAQQNEHIDAFIYGDHIDESDVAPYLGLRAYAADDTPISMTAKQPTYEVFSLIDTDKSEEVTEFVAATVGEDTFKNVMGSKVKYKNFNERTVLSAITAETEEYEGKYNKRLLYSFSDGTLGGFYFSDGTDYIELRKDETSQTVLYAQVRGIPAEYKGISNNIADGAFKKAQYVTLDVKAEAPSGVSTLKLMLLLQNNGDGKQNRTVYEGEVSINANEWTEVTFNIKDFIKEANGNPNIMKILICTEDGETVSGDYGIWLRGVSLQVKKGMPVIVKILLGLLIAALILVAAYGVLYLRAQYIRKKRRTEAERKRREIARMQVLQQQRMHQQQMQQVQGQRPPIQRPQGQWQQGQQYRTGQMPAVRPPYGNTQNGQYRAGQPQNNGRNPNGNTQVFSTSQIKNIDNNNYNS